AFHIGPSEPAKDPTRWGPRRAWLDRGRLARLQVFGRVVALPRLAGRDDPVGFRATANRQDDGTIGGGIGAYWSCRPRTSSSRRILRILAEISRPRASVPDALR